MLRQSNSNSAKNRKQTHRAEEAGIERDRAQRKAGQRQQSHRTMTANCDTSMSESELSVKDPHFAGSSNKQETPFTQIHTSTSAAGKHEEDFRLVKSRRNRTTFKKQIGTATITDEQRKNGFAGIQRKVWLHIYRVTRTTTTQMIVDYVKKSDEFKEVEIMVKEIPTKEDRYKNFLLTAPLNKKDILYDLSFWPDGIGIKRFNFHRNKDFLSQGFL